MKEIAKIASGGWQWIGITDIASEGSYVYDSTGQSINFNVPWNNGIPRGASNPSYDCLCLFTNNGHSVEGKLTDLPCLYARRSICEL